MDRSGPDAEDSGSEDWRTVQVWRPLNDHRKYRVQPYPRRSPWVKFQSRHAQSDAQSRDALGPRRRWRQREGEYHASTLLLFTRRYVISFM